MTAGVRRPGTEGDGGPVAETGLFEQFLDFAPDAIVGIDKAGGIALVNQQTERLFGYSRAELLGKPVEMLLPERLREAIRPTA
jgi:PAS domain S-box-containing protein